MKKLFYVLIALMVTLLLVGCFETGSSAPPPPWAATVTSLPYSPDQGATAGDGRVKLEWIATPGVEYWVFSATDPSLTAFNWTGLANAKAVVAAPTPSYMCGLIDNLPYYFATNGRIDGGPGGPSSPTITATPYNASANWQLNVTNFSSNIYGLGYTGLTTCANNTALSATGTFAAVGAAGAIFTSPDGMSWTPQASTTTTNLNAITGYAIYQNNPITRGLRWVAVGDFGISVYSLDGIYWTVGNRANSNSLANPNNYSLRSITQVGGTFWAVGDAGTILYSPDGITWTSTWTSTTASNLNGVSYAGGLYVAVGDNGTIVTNSGVWSVKTITPSITSNLHQVAAIATVYGSIYVAVGDNGTIVTSDSLNHNGIWTAQTLPGTPNLVGVAAEPLAVKTTTAYTTAPLPDTTLGFIAAVQFVAIDSAGNTYTSLNGYNWTASVSTGITACTTGTSCMNPLISSGFGYVVAGDNSQTAYAF